MKFAILFALLLLPFTAGAENLAINELPGLVTFDPPTSDGLQMVATGGYTVGEIAQAVCGTVGKSAFSYEVKDQKIKAGRRYWTLDGSLFRIETNGSMEMFHKVVTSVVCRDYAY